MPVESDAVAHALGEHLDVRSVGLHPQDGRHHGRRHADVARRADRHVQQVVGTEGDELPRVAGLRVRQAVTHDDRRGRRVEVPLDVVEPQQPARGRHVERAVSHRDAVGLIEPAGDHHHAVGLVVAVAIDDRMHLAGVRDPTNTVPCGPSAIARAFSTFSANTSTWNPAGTTNWLSGGAA